MAQPLQERAFGAGSWRRLRVAEQLALEVRPQLTLDDPLANLEPLRLAHRAVQRDRLFSRTAGSTRRNNSTYS